MRVRGGVKTRSPLPLPTAWTPRWLSRVRPGWRAMPAARVCEAPPSAEFPNPGCPVSTPPGPEQPLPRAGVRLSRRPETWVPSQRPLPSPAGPENLTQGVCYPIQTDSGFQGVHRSPLALSGDIGGLVGGHV